MSHGALAGDAGKRVSPLTALGRRVLFAAAERIRFGYLEVQLPDGSRRGFGDPSADHRAEIHVHHDEALRRLLLHGETGAGEAYMDGQWSSPDLAALLSLAAVNRESLALTSGWWRMPAALVRTLAHRANRNTKANSRRNIARHYDLSNDLYQLFLDETMTYSSAVFETDDQPLHEAQRAKYRRMAERAGIGPGMHVLEIGSGWGGFAIWAASQLGCRVTTITISEAQRALAVERIAAAGLSDRIDVQLRDYRDVHGTYDAVVSIEMLEAVGAEYFEAFFGAVDRALVPGGRASIQTIALTDDAYQQQRRGANWIQKHIFPGGLLPSLAALDRATRRTQLLLTGVTDIREHYARTLQAWRGRFMDNVDAVHGLGFDERFVRMWEYYLALCEAGFSTGIFQDLQLVFEKRRAVLPA
jgi:cyclopropane-fatty-acyl-phospholipid synthase